MEILTGSYCKNKIMQFKEIILLHKKLKKRVKDA